MLAHLQFFKLSTNFTENGYFTWENKLPKQRLIYISSKRFLALHFFVGKVQMTKPIFLHYLRKGMTLVLCSFLISSIFFQNGF